MDNTTKLLLTNEVKDSFMTTLSSSLTLLRTMAEISLDELANLIVRPVKPTMP